MQFKLIAALALAAVASANPVKRAEQCNTGPVQCCNSVQKAGSPAVAEPSWGFWASSSRTSTSLSGVTCSPHLRHWRSRQFLVTLLDFLRCSSQRTDAIVLPPALPSPFAARTTLSMESSLSDAPPSISTPKDPEPLLPSQFKLSVQHLPHTLLSRTFLKVMDSHQ
ncbi:hypothetical protein NMY22_g3839 [Coprinellus aureogranulatus]|nr:hypothetical protein NMY22_g3839 [Coprinellus aureogranulatus]